MTRTEPMLELARDAMLAHRRAASGLESRVALDARSMRAAAWAGLTDSMPRSALLSIQARVAGAGPDAWEDPALVQVWGPRCSAYVVPRVDHWVFTLGRLPDRGHRRDRAESTAAALAAYLGDRRMPFAEAARGMARRDANSLRYATTTGTVLIRWDGARQPTIWCVPRPEIEPRSARHELVRRFLHVMGPGTAESFGRWAGVVDPQARATFAELSPELVAVRTPIGDAWILARDEASFRGDGAVSPAPARLLPSGDTFTLAWARDRELLVPDPARRAELWTSRVWPGALLLDGELAGTWRRAGAAVDVTPWRPLGAAERTAIEAEVAGWSLPGVDGPLRVAIATG